MQTTNNKPISNNINQPRSRRKLIRNIIIGLVGFAVCGGTAAVIGLIVLANTLNGIGDFLKSSHCDVSNPAGIQEVAELKLPPSAKLLTSSCWGMQGWGAFATFEMKPSDLNTFLGTTDVKQPLSDTNRPEKLHCACADNEKITDYLYGKYISHNGNHSWEEEVFIDTRDKNLYIVYFTVLGG